MTTIDRRTFMKLAGLLAISPSTTVLARSQATLVNDMHSQLNPTWVSKIVSVSDLATLQGMVRLASEQEKSLSICGGRHAGGAQQFGTDTVLIDTKNLNHILNFDVDQGLLQVESGINWTQLLNYLEQTQTKRSSTWGIAQKQTGADRLAIGGTVSANAHGQGLQLKPFIGDVESLTLVDAQGQVHNCSRTENPQLFKLAIGGYGLFGMIYSVTLRLVPRRKVERIVEVLDIDQVIAKVDKCIADHYPYGDFQVNIDDTSDKFLRNGIFCGYRPVDPQTPTVSDKDNLNEQRWFDFVYEAHVNKHDTFEKYLHYYQSTSGLVNWSDIWQSGPYITNYHRVIDDRLHSPHRATEVLTEIYVPREKLPQFMESVRADFQKHNVNLIYSTVRFIEKDDESFLAWAKESYACVIFNLHTIHTLDGIEHSANAFRRLIDGAISLGGSYYLTYHKYATKEQVLACYPGFIEFLKHKREFDSEEIFQSNWYRHYKKMFFC